ncbi:winged helix-turn-helix domain-containing protein [Schaalia vaccimaxillae]|uniref:winged helix-turn-helix domain-containing protein n=1 Tax=Schaalia vaccimaxillae TaxID=183916 RepID=UPI0003B711F5|nr:winged helix-turn-helix domain-containing protein [Schaalia vaccimaxillae]
MTLVNTPVAATSSINEAAQTTFDEFLDILAGLKLSSNLLEINLDQRIVTIGGQDASLCGKEYQLLAYLASNADRPVSRQELFETVWNGSGLDSDSRTVDAHIRRLRKKLEAVPDVISTVRGQGYRFNVTPGVHLINTPVHSLAA